MLSKIVQNITPSATCELEGVVADMKAAGVDVIGLTPENRILTLRKTSGMPVKRPWIHNSHHRIIQRLFRSR